MTVGVTEVDGVTVGVIVAVTDGVTDVLGVIVGVMVGVMVGVTLVEGVTVGVQNFVKRQGRPLLESTLEILTLKKLSYRET